MNRLITNGTLKHAKRAPVVLGALLAATLTAAAAGELPGDTTAHGARQGADQDTLRSEMREGAGRAVEETRDRIADDLALRLLGERARERVVAGTDTGKRG